MYSRTPGSRMLYLRLLSLQICRSMIMEHGGTACYHVHYHAGLLVPMSDCGIVLAKAMFELEGLAARDHLQAILGPFGKCLDPFSRYTGFSADAISTELPDSAT